MTILFRLSVAILLSTATAAHALDKVTFLTNWYAEAEHGGFYQALAEGIYEKYGLDVKIGMGGPQVNVYQLLLAEKADFVMGYDVATINVVDKNVAQQGYITSEPYAIEKAGIKPRIFHLAKYGYPPYAQTVVTLTKTVKAKAEVIKRFIEASAPGNALIRKDNPQMDDDQIAFSIAKLKEYGIVDGGDAKKLGLFTMTDARWKQTFEFMRDVKLVKPDVDVHKAYTLEFVKQVKVLP